MVGTALDADRWIYISRQRVFFMTYFGSGLVFSILTSLPGFDESIDDNSGVSLGFGCVIGTVISVCLAVIIWHIVNARITFISSDFYAYLIFRVALVFILSITYYLVHSEPTAHGYANFHLHHYFVAWILSLFASFNHKVSIYFLAITTGIFVQGISAYSAASMFYRGDHQVPCPEFRIG